MADSSSNSCLDEHFSLWIKPGNQDYATESVRCKSWSDQQVIQMSVDPLAWLRHLHVRRASSNVLAFRRQTCAPTYHDRIHLDVSVARSTRLLRRSSRSLPLLQPELRYGAWDFVALNYTESVFEECLIQLLSIFGPTFDVFIPIPWLQFVADTSCVPRWPMNSAGTAFLLHVSKSGGTALREVLLKGPGAGDRLWVGKSPANEWENPQVVDHESERIFQHLWE